MAKDRQTKQVFIKNGMTMWNKLTKTMKMTINFEQNKKMKLFFFCNFVYFKHKILSTVQKYNKRY